MADLQIEKEHNSIKRLKDMHRISGKEIKDKLMGTMLAKCYKEISAGKATQVYLT